VGQNGQVKVQVVSPEVQKEKDTKELGQKVQEVQQIETGRPANPRHKQ
jgi:hypothetical protein